MGGRLKREGKCVYLWLIHVVVWQKLAQHCKAIILQLKKKNKNPKTAWLPSPYTYPKNTSLMGMAVTVPITGLSGCPLPASPHPGGEP